MVSAKERIVSMQFTLSIVTLPHPDIALHPLIHPRDLLRPSSQLKLAQRPQPFPVILIRQLGYPDSAWDSIVHEVVECLVTENR